MEGILRVYRAIYVILGLLAVSLGVSVESIAQYYNGPVKISFYPWGGGSRYRDPDANCAGLKDYKGLFSSASCVTAVAISSDGRRFLTGSSDHALRLWDAATGRLLRVVLTGSNPVTSVGFSANGTRLISTAGSVAIWDTDTGAKVETLGSERGSQSATLTPKEDQILVAGEEGVTLWEIASGRLLRTFDGATGPVALSADGARILSGGADGSLTVWDTATGNKLSTVAGHKGAVGSVAWSLDGARYVTTGRDDNTATLWEAATGKLLNKFVAGFDPDRSRLRSAVLSPDGTRVAIAGAYLGVSRYFDQSTSDWMPQVRVWDTSGPKLLFGTSFVAEGAMMTSVAFSSDGRRLLSGNTTGATTLWEAKTGEEIATFVGGADGNEWLTSVPEGFFEASSNGLYYVVVNSYPSGVPVEALRRPDLVQEKLAGDPDHHVLSAALQLHW